MKKELFLSLIVFLISCQESKDPSFQVKSILLDINAGQELRLSEIADTVEVIFLEQTDDSDIAYVERIIPYKDRYYVMSSIGFSNGRLHMFDKSGNFLQEIGRRGGGPGEYVDLQDVTLDPKNEELVLMTQPKGLYRYDLQGNFIGGLRGGYGMTLAADSDGNIYKTNRCNKDNPDRLLMVNDNDSVSFGWVDEKYFVMVNHYSFSNEFDTCNGKVYYSYPCCDTIFDVTGGHKVPFLYIDYCGGNLPVDEIFAEGRTLQRSREMESSYDSRFRTDVFRLTDKFLYVGSVDGENHGVVSLYSFKTGKVLSGHRLIDDVFFPDNNFTFRPFRMPIAVEGDCLLWLVNPLWLLQGYEYYKENLSPEDWERYCIRYPQMTSVCSKLDEESNPVLLKIKIKDF